MGILREGIYKLLFLTFVIMTHYEAQILKSLNLLEKSQQNDVLSYVKSLLKKENKKQLLKLAGAFSAEDIKQMETAIEQGCENIDRNEW